MPCLWNQVMPCTNAFYITYYKLGPWRQKESNFKQCSLNSEWRPQNIHSLEEKKYFIIKLATHSSLLSLHISKLDVLFRQNKTWTFGHPFQSKKLPICTQKSDLQSFYVLPIWGFEFLWAITTFNWQMRAHFLQKIVLFLLVHKPEFLENLVKNNCIRTYFKANG